MIKKIIHFNIDLGDYSVCICKNPLSCVLIGVLYSMQVISQFKKEKTKERKKKEKGKLQRNKNFLTQFQGPGNNFKLLLINLEILANLQR